MSLVSHLKPLEASKSLKSKRKTLKNNLTTILI
jgi:hypothetical protein